MTECLLRWFSLVIRRSKEDLVRAILGFRESREIKAEVGLS